MDDARTEQETVTAKSPEIIDILSGHYQFHSTPIKNLGKILSRGLYSPLFAGRIKDKEFQPVKMSSDERYVYVTPLVNSIWYASNLVGIAVDVPQILGVPLRIAPPQFVGLVVVDKKSPTNPFIKPEVVAPVVVLKKVEQLRIIVQSGQTKIKPLPIYGTSGDLYWPKRMSHEEIVKMLKEKEE